jgi:MFS transporter, FSR family, fosmidomycin resistance protein
MTDLALEAPNRESRVMGVIGIAHCASHFFQLVLPPLFPLLKDGFGVGFTQLGIMMAVLYSVSAISQVVAGFVVDHVGAHRVLPIGIACLGCAMAGVGLASSYWMLLPLAGLAGIGNAVFHPADYSILTARVAPARLARAYSVHTVSGTIGWAISPVVMLTLSQWLGWRGALLAVGVFGLVLAGVVASLGSELATGPQHHATAKRGATVDTRALFSAPILMAFLYFMLLAIAGGATQNFFPSTLPKVQDVTLALAATITTAYLSASAFGSFAGGYLADMTTQHDRVVAVGLSAAALLALLIGFAPMPIFLLFAAATIMGFLSGLTLPARDMLVRAATPPGSTGKVFGFVYSGLDLGSLVAPPVVGALIDNGHVPWVFVFIAVALAATVGAAIAVNHNRH